MQYSRPDHFIPPRSLSTAPCSHSPPRSSLYVAVPFDSIPPPVMVTSQVPTIFLSTSCSGPGFGGCPTAGAASTTSTKEIERITPGA